MDPAETMNFLELVRALWTFRKTKTNPLKRLKVSNELLDIFYEKSFNYRLVTHFGGGREGQPGSPG